ncbi:MAG TPA: serine/threonine-protein kinase [Steroidobacteraceae bacterium]|nr:serine/threonine-protein kinase [Steroidobacteraceae bacterium]HRX88255.1 serine/threonine-protein kinase [Steroidobacteraceae bacterium]
MLGLDLDSEGVLTLNRLLDEVLDRPPAERAGWLESLPPQWQRFKPHLQDLLARSAAVETADFLNTMPKFAAPSATADATGFGAPVADALVGPYRLLREVGQGGMGAVWLAERADGLIQRQVALKLPHGSWALTGLAERMARERQILATLDHRNIAKLFDAGLTSQGQPYLALEYVAGRPIDQYCARAADDEPLGLAVRLRLFLQVAYAVAYAHNKLAIHRDLKPANILVTPDGGVRLLDFGIAKLLEGGEAKESRLTELSGRAMTPDYASPEQISGESLTVASDVYSLGVILFELLTGERPYRLARDSRGALEDAILQSEPARPSEVAPQAWRRNIRGDLDNIVLKALKKQPGDRYATVNDLAEDIARYLDDRPVLARPDSAPYRMRKFAVRNKLAVVAVTAVCIAILAGTSAAVWQARAAMQQRDLALQQQRRAENVKNLVIGIFRDADPDENGGRRPAAADLLRQAARKIEDATLDDPLVRAEMLRVLGASLMSTKDFDAAKQVLDRAAADAQRDFAPADADRLRLHVLRGDLLRYLGQVQAWRAELDQVEPYLDVLKGAAPEEYVTALKAHAHWEIHSGRYAEANDWAKRAHHAAAELLGKDSESYVRTLTMLATTFTYLRDAQPAVDFAERSYRGSLALHRNNPRHPIVIDSRRVLALAYDISGQPGRALQELEAAIRDGSTTWGPSNATVGYYYQFLSNVQRRLGRLENAVESARQSLAIAQVNDVSADSLEYLGREHSLARALLELRRTTEAEPLLHAISDKAAILVGRRHPTSRAIAADLALAVAMTGDSRAAREQIDKLDLQAIELASPEFAHTLTVTGASAYLAGDIAAAVKALVDVLRMSPGSFRDNDRAEAMLYLGLAQLESRDPRDAEVRLRTGLKLLDNIGYQSSPLKSDALAALARIRTP